MATQYLTLHNQEHKVVRLRSEHSHNFDSVRLMKIPNKRKLLHHFMSFQYEWQFNISTNITNISTKFW